MDGRTDGRTDCLVVPVLTQLADTHQQSTDCAVRHHPHSKHDLHSGSQDHHPTKNSVQKTICCNSTSNAPDDGLMYPKHVELKIHQ